MAQGTLKIHTENILPIIKKWLYSDKDIFIRELVSNACDAMQKCKVLREHNQIEAIDDEFRIDIVIDKEKRTLTISDTGIGMTAEEVEKYIAQIAFSGAEEFLGKYKTKDEKDQIIGHFGLGFYSAYMVAEKVTIDTLSYQNNSAPVFWSCDGSSEYQIDAGSRSKRGTDITLHIDKENDEFLEEGKIRSILQQYCAFLPFPIYLNGTHLNSKQPLWIKPANECTEQEYLEFYRALYPMDPDPIFWIHLNVDYPFHLKGILYFPKITRRFDWNHSLIKLFCNRVFVSDNCKDLIPDYLMVLRGAIDSPDIPLNVSRSYLQMDRTVRQLSSHIAKKVTDRLSSLYTSDKEKFIEAWPDIEMIIKLGILQDEKFYERSKEFLVWKNLSDEWTTVEQYLERNKENYKGKVFYTSDDKNHSHFLELYKSKGIEVLQATTLIDTPLINFLESKLEDVQFQRIDGSIDESILDPSREKTLLDAEGKTEASKIADFIRTKLQNEHLNVEAKSLSSDNVPAFIVVDEEMRRMRETLALSQQSLPPSLMSKRTFVVNTNNKLVQSIFAMKEQNPELANEMVHHLYELSLLSQKELEPSAISQFVSRSNKVLEHLMR
ncbi:MAG: molecular chaperone HtpG [Parachlamydiales bacterium]|nr:molecular chaperone HtpG [Candidatus Acheromyda pituitae]